MGVCKLFSIEGQIRFFFVFKKNFAGHAGPVGTAQLWRYRAEGAVDTR